MTSLALAKLANRKILRISGPDCYSYLQGLVCNDVRYLYEPDRIPQRKHAIPSPNSISTFMLNAQGRAICDMILYRTPSTRPNCEFAPPGQAVEDDELLIECDSNLASGLANTLYAYRVRRKISLSIEDDITVWSLFPKYDGIMLELPSALSSQSEIDKSTRNQLIQIDPHLGLKQEVLSDNITIVNDPRLTSMGLRIISRRDNSEQIKRSLGTLLDRKVVDSTLKEYTLFRFMLGVGEGVKDHLESNCLPLECNADFLGSVSFDKGCYLGQELTARIHYTGVVRKRLMPIILNLESGNKKLGIIPLVSGSDIIDEATKAKVGVLRHVVKDRALALLRHELAIKSKQLLHEGSQTKLSTHVPFWWTI